MQYPLATIDKAGRQLGHVAPKYPPNLDTATLRAELLRTGGSPNSAASGNAYSRSLLEAVTRDGGFDLENPREHWMDAILECNAPFFGEVITLYQPLACYRIHDGNLWAAIDPTVQKAGILDMARLYLNGADARLPLASPIYANLTSLAPLLIQVGAAETLLDDAIRLARVAGAADVRVDLQIWPEMIHVWHLFHPEIKAGLRAIEQGGSLVSAMIATR
jgi:hypothetical protein